MATFIIDSKLIEEIAAETEVSPDFDLTLLDFIRKFDKKVGACPTLREMSQGLQYIYPERSYGNWLPSRPVGRLEKKNLITFIMSEGGERRSYARLIVNDDH